MSLPSLCRPAAAASLRLDVIERPCVSTLALLEIAAECGLDTTRDAHTVKVGIVQAIVQSAASIRALETTRVVLEHHTIPQLRGELSAARMDAAAWCDQAATAKKAARDILASAIGVVTLFGVATLYLLAR